MAKSLRVLFIEDSEDDAYLLLREIKQGGYEPIHMRVENSAQLKSALLGEPWDLIISDYFMPGFSGLAALQIAKDMKVEAPFILISGSVGEEFAVEAMRQGAQDYILKDRLTRFIPAVERELAEARVRKARNVAEERLRETQRVLSTLLGNLPGMAYRCRLDEAWTLDFASDGCFELTGRHAASIVGESFAKMIHRDDREKTMKSVRDAVDAGRPFQIVHRLAIAEGRQKWVCSQGSIVKSDAGSIVGFEAIATDMTERMRLEETQAQLEARLRQTQKMEALGRLAATVAHDFGNLLAVVRGCSELLVMEGRAAQHKKIAGDIAKAVDLGVGLLRQLRTFSHERSDDFRPVGLNQVISSVEALLRKALGVSELRLACAEDLKPIMADSGQLVQVLINLAVNASDAMPSGGVLSIETSMVLLEDPAGSKSGNAERKPYVLLKVGDSGCGMDEATLSRIFEPFFTTKSADNGTGLGLSIVYSIVKRFNGFIEVESKPGMGTRFSLYFPALENEGARVLPELVQDAR